FQAVAALASMQGVPVTTHLAESPEEFTLIDKRMGSFIDFLIALGVYDEAGLVNSVPSVVKIFSGLNVGSFSHCNYLEQRIEIPRGQSVVYCPRTHATFGHSKYPLKVFLDSGINVALGTDSLASNPDLNVLAEARFVRTAHPEITGENVLEIAT